MFELLIDTFNTLLYRPLFNFLVLIYNYLPWRDFGLAIIVLTLAIRLILYPSSVKSAKSQKALNELQPKIQEIKEKHKGNKEQQAKATMELYKKEKINPFGGCLPTLIQFPFLIALFLIFRNFQDGLDFTKLAVLYNFVPSPGIIAEPMFLGLINLAQPNTVLAVLAGIFQFIQTKMIMSKTKKSKTKGSDFSRMMQKQMIYFFPVITVLILLKLPAAIGFYWIISSLFLIIQQYFILKKRPAEAGTK